MTSAVILPSAAQIAAAPPALRRAAEELEGVFLSELLQPVFEAFDTDGLGGGGAGERTFRPMLVQEYAKSMVAAGGIGLADALLADLVRMQAGQPLEP